MKGVIIAAGYGTRFLPVTKTVPKEMLPLIDRPAIDFIIEEFVNSGITEILIITSRRKKVLDDYFDREPELETLFLKECSKKKFDAIQPPNAEIFFKRQTDMFGTGLAIMQAQSFTGNEPFVVAYPDDLHFGNIPLAKQLIEKFEETGCCVMSALHNPPQLERYGVLALDHDKLHITDIVEKPPKGKEPGKEASIGRYLFTPDIYDYLKEGWNRHLQSSAGGEYFYVFALKKLMDLKQVVVKIIEGERIDVGTPSGFLRAIIRYAKKDNALFEVLKEEAAALCAELRVET